MYIICLLIFKQHLTLYGDPPPPPKVQLCTILNNEIHAKVKIATHLSSEFKVNKDVRQGDAIAPLEIQIRRSKIETQGNVLHKCSQMMAYADDVVIMGRRLLDVEEVLTSLVKQTNKMGLELNFKKR